MRFLADENLPIAGVRVLRNAGYDVTTMSEIDPGASDQDVLAVANREGRILLTFDRDHGRLIFAEAVLPPPGVVHLRFIPETPEEPAHVVLRLIREVGLILEGSYTVIRRRDVRQHPLPR